ncbi:conserved hypothetical protein [Ricinus communis]|uniref:Uncharacterized protein n=1 Tax=Ricinus communis TaxID=3988 RepID=B9TEV2_RICCO|nr:conserved hypothetical protein [Ricinus communis]
MALRFGLNGADTPVMNITHDPVDGPDPSIFSAHAISLAVGTIRRAQGKLLPRDCVEGSAEWLVVMEAFARDVARALDAYKSD